MQLKLTLAFSSILGISLLTGCVYQEGFAYNGPYNEGIWADSNGNRYGHGSRPPQAERYERFEPTESPRRASSSSPYRTYTGTNRYGASSTRYHHQYPPGAPARLSGSGPRETREDDRDFEPLARNDANERPSQPGGFSRATTEPRNEPLASVPPAPEPKPEPREEKPASRPANDFSHLPFAVPVPGKAGYVTLPGHQGLPEIDVRGMAPGTPVEIPNPAQPGKTIQFRVP